MKLKTQILAVLTLSLALYSYGQKGVINKGAKKYENFSYIKTTDILLEVANQGYKSVDLFEKLGNAYYFTNQMEDASRWYGELMKLDKAIDPENYYRYAQALKAIQDYAEADKWMEKFASIKSDELRSKVFKAKPDAFASSSCADKVV